MGIVLISADYETGFNYSMPNKFYRWKRTWIRSKDGYENGQVYNEGISIRWVESDRIWK